jgi:predicted TIM-barrel fold metal-dependent hydrolase
VSDVSSNAGRDPTGNKLAYVAYRQEWLDLHREDAIDPALPIVDAHHHLYERPRPRYLFADLLADTGSGHNIVATVYMQSLSMYRQDGPAHLRSVGETEFANGYAAMAASGTYGPTRACAAIVGLGELNIGRDKVAEALDAHVHAGNGRFRGVRHITFWDADARVQPANPDRTPGLLADARFRDGFALLGPRGLGFDAYVCFPQLPELADLARQYPGTAIVLNHLGGPVGVGPYAGARDAVFSQWSASMRELARLPNVSVKIGGLGMRVMGYGFHDRDTPPTSQQLARAWKPWIEETIQCFGPGRCMFESNFPPDRGSFSYGVLWNAFKRLAAGYAPDERTQLFSGTANRVYRLNLDIPASPTKENT